MKMKYYDATKEFAPFDRSGADANRHPNKNLTTPHPVSGKRKQ
jgi:hypothetical protein